MSMYLAIYREISAIFVPLGIVLLLWGLANAFFGYKIFKVVLAITGFFTGMLLLPMVVGLFLFFSTDISEGSSIALIVLLGLVGGVIGAVLAVLLYKVGGFVSVGMMGVIMFFVIVRQAWLALVLGIICGIVGVILDKYVIIVSTGLSGGSLAGVGVGMITGNFGAFLIAIGLIFGICGIVFQVWMERRRPAAVAAAVGAAAAAPVYAAAPPPQYFRQPQPPQPSAPAAPTGACCPNCGSPLPKGGAFCSMCGRTVQTKSGGATVFCAKCGAEIPGSANFCGKCGASRAAG